MSLRVISGVAKGKRLKRVPGDSTRPIMDRAKEALFNIIGAEIYNARFLDLFAGTGSVGIEALSRGAREALLVDLNNNAIRTIQANLQITGLGDKAIIRRTNALALLNGPPPADPFDFIYVAPPQYKGIWLDVLKALDAKPDWVPDDETEIIVQIDPKEYEATPFKHLKVTDQRRYGKTMLVFLTRNEVEADE